MAAVPDLDGRQLAELTALSRQASQDALADPATLARFLDPTFASRMHLRVIADALRDVAAGGCTRLLIEMPPQTGKSTLIARWAPFWWLAQHPTDKVIVASYARQLALTRGRAVRRDVAQHGWRYGMRVARGSGAVDNWELETGGGLFSTSVGALITGFPGNIVIVDDPHKGRAEADSLAMRDHVWDWWSADLLSRLSPDAPVILLLTPWSPDDLRGRVLEQDGREDEGGLWRVIRLPAFADSRNDPLGREPGGPLTHPLIPAGDTGKARRHWEGRRATTMVRDWHALYMCDPRPTEGALLTWKQLRAARCIPAPAEPAKTAVAVDPSGGGRDTAGITGGFLAADERLYVTHDRSGVMSANDWGREVCRLAYETDAQLVVVETNYGGDQATTVVRTAWSTLQLEGEIDAEAFPPRISSVRGRKGKLLRAEPVAQQLIEDRMRFGAYLPELEQEWASWVSTDTSSPGRIDASTYLAYALLPIPGSRAAVSTAADVPRSQVAGAAGGWAATPIRR